MITITVTDYPISVVEYLEVKMIPVFKDKHRYHPHGTQHIMLRMTYIKVLFQTDGYAKFRK